MAEIKINRAGLNAVYQQVADKIQATDAQLRQRVAGQPLDVVEPQASAALSQIGVTLPAEDLRAYAQSITDGQDFKFVLQ